MIEGIQHIWQDMSKYGQGKIRFCERCGKKEVDGVRNKPCLGGIGQTGWLSDKKVTANGANYDPFAD